MNTMASPIRVGVRCYLVNGRYIRVRVGFGVEVRALRDRVRYVPF